MQNVPTQTMNILHQTMHTYNTYLHLLHSSRVFHQAGICEAGEAGDLWRCGVQMLLCWARAAVPARLYPSENHYRQRWLSLPAQWWVARKPSFFGKHYLCFGITYSLQSRLLFHCCRHNCGPFWSEQLLWEEHRPEGYCRSPPGLSLHSSVCLISLPSVTWRFVFCFRQVLLISFGSTCKLK